MLDLNGFFALCSVAVVGLTVIACFCIYFGVTVKKENEIIEIISGRKQKEESGADELTGTSYCEGDEDVLLGKKSVDDYRLGDDLRGNSSQDRQKKHR